MSKQVRRLKAGSILKKKKIVPKKKSAPPIDKKRATTREGDELAGEKEFDCRWTIWIVGLKN